MSNGLCPHCLEVVCECPTTAPYGSANRDEAWTEIARLSQAIRKSNTANDGLIDAMDSFEMLVQLMKDAEH